MLTGKMNIEKCFWNLLKSKRLRLEDVKVLQARIKEYWEWSNRINSSWLFVYYKKLRDLKVWQNYFSLPAFFQSSQTSPQSVKRKRQQRKIIWHLQKLTLSSVVTQILKEPTAPSTFWQRKNYCLLKIWWNCSSLTGSMDKTTGQIVFCLCYKTITWNLVNQVSGLSLFQWVRLTWDSMA